MKIAVIFLVLCCQASAVPPEKSSAVAKSPDAPAKTASLKPEQIADFDRIEEPLAAMLRYALSLTEKNLAYHAGSDDPASGGTDCSGFVCHVLRRHGHAGVPRQSDEMYAWTWKAGTFRACNSKSMETFEFSELRPGDLLFWVNSTADGRTDRDPPVTHVMIYLGRRASDGHPVVAGASDGRSYDGQAMNGVSVFDFRLPPPGSPARFIGYAHLPPPGAVPAAEISGPKPAAVPPAAPKRKPGSTKKPRSKR